MEPQGVATHVSVLAQPQKRWSKEGKDMGRNRLGEKVRVLKII